MEVFKFEMSSLSPRYSGGMSTFVVGAWQRLLFLGLTQWPGFIAHLHHCLIRASDAELSALNGSLRRYLRNLVGRGIERGLGVSRLEEGGRWAEGKLGGIVYGGVRELRQRLKSF